MPDPIKRHKSLKPLSREHHHSLLLCWKIRTGFSKGVAVERIKEYSDWFFKAHVKHHFEVEEKYVFPVLGMDHELVKKALAQHRRLERLFKDKKDIEKSLSLIEEELTAHIRFEERVLFNKIQTKADGETLKMIAKKHAGDDFEDNTEDEFWK
jgi:iron-sulfur cluster repair protein YtfE (RIC family)